MADELDFSGRESQVEKFELNATSGLEVLDFN
jgi:hypothetical protein